MSLVPIPIVLRQRQAFRRLLLGTVMDNVDPKGLGAVRVFVPGLIEGPTDALPWAYREESTFLGGGESFVYGIPAVGSIVRLECPEDNPYVIIYRGVIRTQVTSAVSQSPDKWGFSDGHGTAVMVDTKKKEMSLALASGVRLVCDKLGSVSVLSPKRIALGVADPDSGKPGGSIVMDSCNVAITAPAEITLKAPTINQDGSAPVKVSASTMFMTLDGQVVTVVDGIVTEAIK